MTTTETNTADITPAAEAQPGSDAPHTDPGPSLGDPTADGGESLTDEPDEPQDSPGSEAAKYRVRLRAAEHERDEALAHVARLQRAAVDEVLAAADIDGRLLDAAGHAVEDFLTDDGLVDRSRLTEVAQTVADEFGVSKPRRPQPNPLAGTAVGSAGPSGKDVWDATFTLKGGRGR